MKRIVDYLGLDPMPIRFEKISDDSRIYFQAGYIAINEYLKDNYFHKLLLKT